MKEERRNQSIRNVAIIAHVDHGKTTLVDHMLRQCGTFREGADVAERVMDNMDLERERGITIAAKNCSMHWRGVKINIVDTPGHADFGGEVERALQMVDGAILLVDSSEGPLPQTRYVVRKALEAALNVIVVVNKIDRQDARPAEVLDEVYSLFIDLDANDEQIEFPVLYAVGRDGSASKSLEAPGSDLSPLFDQILETVPGPLYHPDEPFQMGVYNLGYSDYLGRLAIGRVHNGTLHKSGEFVRIDHEGVARPFKLSSIQAYRGLQFEPAEEIGPGDIAVVAGADEVEIGDTICTKAEPRRLRRLRVDEPTISARFTVNTSPFSGREGRYVQSTKLVERLEKEMLHNVALRLQQGDDPESYLVQGRGEFQIAILVETMRREGYELSVGRPEIILREENGETLEPIEQVFIDCDEAYTGVVTEKLSLRKGRMVNLVNHGSGRVRMEFSAPSRGLIGYRSEFLTDTRGTGILNAIFSGYEEYRGEFPTRTTGSLVADRMGEALTYALFHLEPRGRLLVSPGDKVYEGMIVGEHNRGNDLNVNVCKAKKLSNMRASGKDEALTLTPVQPLTIEQALDFIKDDEMIEVTPKSIRLRKLQLLQSARS